MVSPSTLQSLMAADHDAELIAERALAHLRAAGVTLDPGLTGSELAGIEERLGCALPPDLRILLGTSLPSGDRFPTWRELDSSTLAGQLQHPVEGIAFDVEHAGFWHPAWPSQPDELDEAIAIARAELATAPMLIPVYAHRYLPSEPCRSGNPVLSVMQTDVIYYGQNLVEYVENDHRYHRWQVTQPLTRLPFWSYLLDAD